ASGVVGEALLNGSLLYAILAYISVALAYLRMRWKYPHLNRPFNLGNFFGPFCALVTLTSYISALVNMFYNQIFRDTLYVCLGKLGFMLLFFAVLQRTNMVETPEEEFIQRYLNSNDDIEDTEEERDVVTELKNDAIVGFDTTAVGASGSLVSIGSST
ncbi:UNVERIFIED_CONTAM: hypothetical protein HDU68_004103, partial [Siphonaria sp. JEL0065]